MSVREILAGHIDAEAIEQLRTLIRALAPSNQETEEPPVEAHHVVRAVAVAHIRHIEYHAQRLGELASLLAATLKDPRRAFHSGQLNVAMMIVRRLAGHTASICVEQILDEDDAPPPNTPQN